MSSEPKEKRREKNNEKISMPPVRFEPAPLHELFARPI
jgi:hypothetical protein